MRLQDFALKTLGAVVAALGSKSDRIQNLLPFEATAFCGESAPAGVGPGGEAAMNGREVSPRLFRLQCTPVPAWVAYTFREVTVRHGNVTGPVQAMIPE